MNLSDFNIRLYNIQERQFKPRSGNPTPRKLFSFNLEWKGLIDGSDPMKLESYLGMSYTGCLLTVTPQGDLDWSPPKTSSGRGFQLAPTKPNEGLYKLILEHLSRTPQARALIEDYQSRVGAFIPGDFGASELLIDGVSNG